MLEPEMKDDWRCVDRRDVSYVQKSTRMMRRLVVGRFARAELAVGAELDLWVAEAE
jgi:hypothetical protein